MPIKYISVIALLSVAAWSAAGQDLLIDGQAPHETISIGRMTKPPVLDGNLDDWPADTTSIVLGSAAACLRRHFTWTGTRDSSAVVRLAWDDEALYVAADVCDDKLVQVTDDKEIYQGDSLELFFNISPGQYRVDSYWQIAIAPPLQEGEKLRVVGRQKPFEGVEGQAKIHEGGYTMECRIPWSNMPGFTPASGHTFGTQIMLDDRDAKGRKSQQIWYPSAMTYAQPADMNILRLADRGDTTQPRIAGGPNTWCVFDPKKMDLSLIADVPEGKSAEISLISSPQRKPVTAQNEPLLTLPLEANGPRVKTAQGTLTGIDDLDGLCDFGVTVKDGQGKVLATGNFQAELSARPYARIRELVAKLLPRLKALDKNPAVDPVVLEGLTQWMQRSVSFLNNESKPESTSRWLLDQLAEEMEALEAAVTRCEAGADPYDGVTGSFVKAYVSPLTGKPRPLAFLVPRDYNAREEKRWPLIYLLHGMYADERELSSMAAQLRDLGAIVCMAPAYRQFDWNGVSGAESWAGFDEVLKEYKIDLDRVYLIGNSIGGRGVWQFAEGRPDLWAACAPLLSGVDVWETWPVTALYPQYLKKANDFQMTYTAWQTAGPSQPFGSPLEKKLLEQASLASRVENIVDLPLRHSYGEENPLVAAERMAIIDRFTELGVRLATHEIPGASHGSTPSEFQSPEFYQWLLAHRRPPTPSHVHFTANTLRYNSAWWVRVDQLNSPGDLGRIDATLGDGKIDVKTSGLSAFTLNPQDKSAWEWPVTIDGQAAIKAKPGKAPALSFVRDTHGRWEPGSPKPSGKKHGLSGPIDDFQFERFMIVYGTQGDEKANALLAKMGNNLSNWGLGAIFECKADKDVTPDDLRQKHLVLVGTPQNNSVLAKMKDSLPVKWSADGMSMGPVRVSGPGAGVCFIQPNPLSPARYAVVVSANDEEGYAIWQVRGPSNDYVFGSTKTVDEKPAFTVTAYGCFDNQWHWTREGCVPPPAAK